MFILTIILIKLWRGDELKIQLPSRHILLFLPLLFVSASCKKNETFEGGFIETKPANRDGSGIDASHFRKNDSAILHHAYYDAQVMKKDGEVVCKGTLEVIAKVDKILELGDAPCHSAIFKTLVESIDLSGKDDPDQYPMTIAQRQERNLTADIDWITGAGQYSFTPGVPKRLSPVVQGHDRVKGLIWDNEVTAYTTDEVTKKEVYTKGRVKFEVHEVNMNFKPRAYHETLNNVVHYTIEADGFDEITGRGEFGLHQYYEYYYRTDPAEMVQLKVVGPVTHFQQNKLKGVSGNVLFGGEITIDISLRKIHRETDDVPVEKQP